MNQLSYYVTKRLIVGSKDSSGTIINDIHLLKLSFEWRQPTSGYAAISCPWWVTGGDAAIAHGQQRLQPITDMAAYSALRC